MVPLFLWFPFPLIFYQGSFPLLPIAPTTNMAVVSSTSWYGRDFSFSFSFRFTLVWHNSKIPLFWQIFFFYLRLSDLDFWLYAEYILMALIWSAIKKNSLSLFYLFFRSQIHVYLFAIAPIFIINCPYERFSYLFFFNLSFRVFVGFLCVFCCCLSTTFFFSANFGCCY